MNTDLVKENELLKQIIVDLHWMAQRYAHGRMSYAVDTFNGHVRTLVSLGVLKNDGTGETPWARDGNFGWPAEHKEPIR